MVISTGAPPSRVLCANALRWDSPAASIFGFADTNDRLKPDD